MLIAQRQPTRKQPTRYEISQAEKRVDNTSREVFDIHAHKANTGITKCVKKFSMDPTKLPAEVEKWKWYVEKLSDTVELRRILVYGYSQSHLASTHSRGAALEYARSLLNELEDLLLRYNGRIAML